MSHLRGVGARDPVLHVAEVDSRLDADQLVGAVVWFLEGGAELQRRLPGHLLLHQQQVVLEAGEGEPSGAVVSAHVCRQGVHRDAVTVGRRLVWPPVCVVG